MNNKLYCLALDLKDDLELIQEYEKYHSKGVIWPEIIVGIKKCNIIGMRIFRTGNRLCMLLETNEHFDLVNDFKKMLEQPRQKEWAALMTSFQQKLPHSKENEHWVLMENIFDLNSL